MHRRIRCAVTALGLICTLIATRASADKIPEMKPGQIRVMSFNLRVPTVVDLWNHWDYRKDAVVAAINRFGPDLLGTQECVQSQAKFLREKLTNYEFFGAGRDDGKEEGEMAAVFFRSDRLQKLDGGHFWLSPTPEKPGSHGWGAPFPRVATWVKLRPKDGSGEFFWFNTHLEAFSSHARVEEARFLKQRIATIAGSSPVILTGDFNCEETTDPYRELTTGSDRALVDAYRAVHATRSKDESSFHGFHGGKRGDRIDWILTSAGFTATDATILQDKQDGRWVSDHYPVTATVQPAALPGHASAR